MTTATHEDIIRLFPDMRDHAALEILEMAATIDELEAASQLLQGEEEGLIDLKQEKGDRLNLLLRVLQQSGIRARDNFER